MQASASQTSSTDPGSQSFFLMMILFSIGDDYTSLQSIRIFSDIKTILYQETLFTV